MLLARFSFSVSAALTADCDSTWSMDIVPSDKPCRIWFTTAPRHPPPGGLTTLDISLLCRGWVACSCGCASCGSALVDAQDGEVPTPPPLPYPRSWGLHLREFLSLRSPSSLRQEEGKDVTLSGTLDGDRCSGGSSLTEALFE